MNVGSKVSAHTDHILVDVDGLWKMKSTLYFIWNDLNWMFIDNESQSTMGECTYHVITKCNAAVNVDISILQLPCLWKECS